MGAERRNELRENEAVPATGVKWGWWPGPTLSGVGALKESAAIIRRKQSCANYTLVAESASARVIMNFMQVLLDVACLH